MGTYVAVHAHPDDEAIATGGTMLLASKAGHRVVLVVATRGECGEVADGFLANGESLSANAGSERPTMRPHTWACTASSSWATGTPG